MASVAEEEEETGTDDADENQDVYIVTTKEARRAIETIRTFVEQSSDVKDDVFAAVVTIENAIDTQTNKSLKQSRITDFFN